MHLAPRSQQENHSWLSIDIRDTLNDKKHAWIKFMGAHKHLTGAMKSELNTLKNNARHMVDRDKRTAWWHKLKALENNFKAHDLHQ